jgi:hypothetical protein
MDVAFTLLLFWTWAGPTVLERLTALADEKVRTLTVDWWLKLNEGIQLTKSTLAQEKREVELNLTLLPKGLTERTVVAISSRISDAASEDLLHKYLDNYEGEDLAVLQLCQGVALRTAQQNPQTWRNWLPVIAQSYAKGAVSDQYFGYRFARAVHSEVLPIEIAEEIVEHCDRYPAELVGWAERTCRQRLAELITPVGRIAKDSGWFKL